MKYFYRPLFSTTYPLFVRNGLKLIIHKFFNYYRPIGYSLEVTKHPVGRPYLRVVIYESGDSTNFPNVHKRRFTNLVKYSFTFRSMSGHIPSDVGVRSMSLICSLTSQYCYSRHFTLRLIPEK